MAQLLPRSRRNIAPACPRDERHLQDQCDADEIRLAHNAIKIVADLACSAEGRAVYDEFQLDALEAIPNDARLGDAFFTEQLPRVRTRAGRAL